MSITRSWWKSAWLTTTMPSAAFTWTTVTCSITLCLSSAMSRATPSPSRCEWWKVRRPASIMLWSTVTTVFTRKWCAASFMSNPVSSSVSQTLCVRHAKSRRPVTSTPRRWTYSPNPTKRTVLSTSCSTSNRKPTTR